MGVPSRAGIFQLRVDTDSAYVTHYKAIVTGSEPIGLFAVHSKRVDVFLPSASKDIVEISRN